MKALSAYKTLATAALAFSLVFSTIACSRFGVTTSFPSGEKITGLEQDQYIAVTTEDGTLVKAVEREIWEKTKTAEPEAGEATEKVAPQYDIPREESWLTADQVLKQAFSMVEQLQKLGTLAPASVRLTTFDQVAHGGEYLPADTPVWYVLFKADGRVWVPTSGPMVRDPKDAYSHTQVVKTVEIALRADSGEQVFQGVSGGPLDTTRQLEEVKGTIADQTRNEGDQVIVEAAGGGAVNVLLPRGMTAVTIDPASGTRTKLTFWETVHLQTGTPVTVRGLMTKSGEFLSYAMEAMVPDPTKNLADIYSLALDSFMPLDAGLNHDMKFISIDTSTLQGATGDDKKQVLRYFEKYGVEVLDASFEQLKAQGHFDEKTLVLDGILLRVKSIAVKSNNMVIIEGLKYRSGDGAIGVRCTLVYEEGKWQVKEAKETWIS